MGVTCARRQTTGPISGSARPNLLEQLPPQRVEHVFARLDAAAGRRPHHPLTELEPHQQHPVGIVDQHGSNGRPQARPGPGAVGQLPSIVGPPSTIPHGPRALHVG